MRNIFKEDKFKYGLNATILIASIIGIVVLLNIILNMYSFKFDMTSNKTYELSQQTKDVLKMLGKSSMPIEAILFTSNNYAQFMDVKQKDVIDRTVRQYEKLSKNLSLKIVDLDKNPALAQKYGIEMPYEIVFIKGERTKVVGLRDFFQEEGFAVEQSLTSAINSLINQNPSVVYVIEGHKELSLDRQIPYLEKYIEREGYTVKTINIASEGKIPDDASMVINFGAATEFAQKEIEILKSYLDNGGRAMFLLNSYFNQPQIANLSGLLKNYGIQIDNNVVIDPGKNKNFAGAQDMIIPKYESSDITDKLAAQRNYYMVIPAARSMNISSDVKDIKIKPLLTTSSQSWGETNIAKYNESTFKYESNDKKGPLTIGAYITKTISEDKEMEIIVVGNDLFITDNVLNITQAAPNVDFVLNSMAALSGNKQNITIRPKATEDKYLRLPTNKQNTLLIFLIILLPAVSFTAGTVVWLKRRHL